jgi:acetyltransferase-like isoleucine patch superfamily enzyme
VIGILRNVALHSIQLLTSLLPNSRYSNRIRGALIAPFFKKCGKNFQIASGVILVNPNRISIGDDVYIAHNVWINGTGEIEIQSGVIVSPMVVIASTKHVYENGKISNLKSEVSKIIIKSGSWVASNTVITKGVIIGEGCIIGACSSVTKDIPDYYFAGGVPAKPIKKIYES